MKEFLTLAALIAFVATATALLIAAAAHYAVATNRPRGAAPRTTDQLPPRRARAE